MEMEVTQLADDVVNVALVGRLDTSGVGRIETRFTATLVPRGARAVVDLSRVEFVSSMGLRMFIAVGRALARNHGKLVLYAPQPPVNEVFETVSLKDMIPVKPDSPSALAVVRS
jgi:anti-sigma B factor antagonist